MKQTRLVLAGILVLAPVFSAMAAPQAATGCEAKRQNIEQQIEHARTHNNDHRVAGLQKALSELNANCTEEGLRAEREADVREKERKVEERRQELAEAQADGRTDKISKKERKLKDAQAELDEARSVLNK
ncbi:DUF1090 domain-containing protein [Enterobacter hormaechei]|uniref:DUF1090 domain-containing protein n=1 Tax=Enterobacter hormaechei TaxID=158836 RepID=UPI0007351A68|nr:DUF1090 domain-containing protein [Enterobacter hormaechei]KTI04362.1 hypothetical protein ASV12_13595 [Enterobacter hormaechei subsp. xiangfangensis]KTI94305.1 hypothetical protein ASU94_23930 [Enterobacter hormaechei subsp. xiangfangensis]HAS1742907.1 DUF1090 domain-containing protein [Enterobacter hormaechei subsp. oharae]HAS1752923.1 DUF1090 domain-containing protein [Enterobacter hormaechei subsp. oharae]